MYIERTENQHEIHLYKKKKKIFLMFQFSRRTNLWSDVRGRTGCELQHLSNTSIARSGGRGEIGVSTVNDLQVPSLSLTQCLLHNVGYHIPESLTVGVHGRVDVHFNQPYLKDQHTFHVCSMCVCVCVWWGRGHFDSWKDLH